MPLVIVASVPDVPAGPSSIRRRVYRAGWSRWSAHGVPDLRQCREQERDRTTSTNRSASWPGERSSCLRPPMVIRSPSRSVPAPAVCHFVMEPGAEITGNVPKGRRGPGHRRDHRHQRHGNDSARGDGAGRRHPSNQKGGSCAGGKGGNDPPDGGHEHLDPGRLRHLRRRQAVPGRRHHASRHPGHGHRRRASLLGEHVLRHGRATSLRAVGRSR